MFLCRRVVVDQMNAAFPPMIKGGDEMTFTLAYISVVLVLQVRSATQGVSICMFGPSPMFHSEVVVR